MNDLPLLPIDVIGTGAVQIGPNSYQGGLYPGGVNTPTSEHQNALSIQIEKIRPRKSGSIVFIGLGASNTSQEMNAFINLAEASGLMNDAIELVNCCKGGVTLAKIMDISGRYTYNYISSVLRTHGFDSSDPQVAWLKTDNLSLPVTPGNFDSYLQSVTDEYIGAISVLYRAMPGLKIIYLTSRHTTRYINTPSLDKHMEPRAFFSQFVIKRLIELQITQADPRLKWSGNNPKVPLLTWGPLFYSDGAEPNTFGHYWEKFDVKSDGLHPSEYGANKTAEYLLDFFLNNEHASKFFADK